MSHLESLLNNLKCILTSRLPYQDCWQALRQQDESRSINCTSLKSICLEWQGCFSTMQASDGLHEPTSSSLSLGQVPATFQNTSGKMRLQLTNYNPTMLERKTTQWTNGNLRWAPHLDRSLVVDRIWYLAGVEPQGSIWLSFSTRFFLEASSPHLPPSISQSLQARLMGTDRLSRPSQVRQRKPSEHLTTKRTF